MFESPVTLVLDIGKTHAKLLAIDEAGNLVEEWSRDSSTSDVPEGYRALDTTAVAAWLLDTLASMGPIKDAVRSIVPITHGAAVAGMGAEGLVLPVPDYEFQGFDKRPTDWAQQLDPFEQIMSPVLPLGLNLATQLDWLERRLPQAFAKAQYWLPYPQYWAWWFSGVFASEVSSLGCHTALWQPREGRWSGLARRRGWADRFAPMRRAWEVVGHIRPELAGRLGLPRGVQVLCGAHDSNACLARYLRSWPRMTLVSTGTWVVVMAPGGPIGNVDSRLDHLANVSVRGDVVPTGRFMGGRMFEALCAGADPNLADTEALARLVASGVNVSPDGQQVVWPSGQSVVTAELPGHLNPVERATLAALFTAQKTARIVGELGAIGPITIDGPFANNPVYLHVLDALLGGVHASTDPLEGTARGGWVLGRWTGLEPTPPLVSTVSAPEGDDAIVDYQRRWLELA